MKAVPLIDRDRYLHSYPTIKCLHQRFKTVQASSLVTRYTSYVHHTVVSMRIWSQ